MPYCVAEGNMLYADAKLKTIKHWLIISTTMQTTRRFVILLIGAERVRERRILVAPMSPPSSTLCLLLLLLVLTTVDIVQEVVQIGFTRRGILPGACRVLVALLLVTLLLLLLRVSSEHYPILDNVRVGLQVRQRPLLAVGPLGNVVHVTLHHGQILPAQSEEARLGPNVTLPSGMSNLARITFPGGIMGSSGRISWMSEAAAATSYSISGF